MPPTCVLLESVPKRFAFLLFAGTDSLVESVCTSPCQCRKTTTAREFLFGYVTVEGAVVQLN